MSDYNDRVVRRESAAGEIDQGLRSYMLRVYNYMTGGVALTGVVAFLVSQSPALMNAIFGTPLQWVVFLGPLAFVWIYSARMHKMSVAGAQLGFWAYAAMLGVMLSFIFIAYQIPAIVRVFFITTIMFGSLSIWGYTTRRDLSAMGTFLFMGLIGLIVAMVVNIFLQSSALHFAISVLGVGIFAGLTAYDTQRIKDMYYQVGEMGDVAAKASIMGALKLYLDFINMFLFLLRLFGGRD